MSAALDSKSTENIDTQGDKAAAVAGQAARKWVDKQAEKNRLREAQARARSRSPSSRSVSSSRSSSPSRLPWEEPLDEYFLASRERLGDAAFTPEMMARIKARMKTACECAARVRAAEPRLKAKINNLRAQLADHSDHPSDGE